MKIIPVVICAFLLCSASFAQTVYNVADFGAKGDGVTVNTQSIQAAIDKCTADGGGRVVIPNGTFLTATLWLKNNVTLYLNETATLKGVGDPAAYSQGALIYAEAQHNISISGKGTIHGHGDHPAFHSKDVYNGIKNRPFGILLNQCKNVRLTEFTLRNGAFWCIKLRQCSNTLVDGINVISRAVANNDGIDITDCFNTRIANSNFDCGDDGICPKSETSVGVKLLVITNCVIKSESNGIKFGTASVGGFEDVAISNCVIHDTRLAGIALEAVDGGSFERIVINNIVMHNVNGGLFMKLGHRKGKTSSVLRNITVTNLTADGIGMWQPDTSATYYKKPYDSKIGMSIVGQPGSMIENITLQNIRMKFAGGGTPEDARRVMPDLPEMYPEYNNFGVTPAYGFNFRHVKNMRLDNMRLEVCEEDARPAFFLEDVDGADISGLHAQISDNAPAFVRCKDVQDLFVHGCKPQAAAIPFLAFEGQTRDVTIMNNDFRKVKEIYHAGSEEVIKEIHLSGNIK